MKKERIKTLTEQSESKDIFNENEYAKWKQYNLNNISLSISK